jgi:8-oxo-dGTP diphosphatase
MQGDGNGWVRCGKGHRHWGVHGSAGLLLRALDPRGRVRVLMQHRAEWTQDGGTWGIPGGARDSHESPGEAALRETVEETGIAVTEVQVRTTVRDDHGGWVYDTVLADTAVPLPVAANAESAELSWVEEAAVEDLPLHPGFRRSWPGLRARPVTLVVDAANVMGSRPDGWWRDRAGSAARLLASVDALRGRVASAPQGLGWIVLTEAVVVLEGAARDAEDGAWATVLRAEGSGDDVLAVVATERTDGRTPAGAPTSGSGSGRMSDVLVVTADRGLRARLPESSSVTGPRWLREQLEV